MGKWDERILGAVRLELTGSFPEGFLNACAMEGLTLWEMRVRDACTLELSAYETEMPELEKLAARCGCEWRLLAEKGGKGSRRRLRRRSLLLLSLALSGLLLLASSLFLWEIELQGNQKLTEGEVRRALAACGVTEGSFWPSISTDLVRSRMLTELPELGWMTVNISGSRALVLLSERREKPEIYRERQPGDVVAAEGGIVRRASVLEGTALVKPGQTVAAGELLVSGWRESLSGEGRWVCARAEIEADTVREIAMVCPKSWQEKGELRRRIVRFALQFGKKRINFYHNSGNKYRDCDKIVKEYKLGIEGLFALPLRLIREEIRVYESREAAFLPEEMLTAQELGKLSHRIDGEILSHRLNAGETGGTRQLRLYVHCRENIAQSREAPA